MTLRPLHQRNLAGHLCARVEDLFIEFRHPSEWDSGIDRPVVLVHPIDAFGTVSVLRRYDAGHWGLDSGMSLTRGPSDPLAPRLTFEVTDINGPERKASIRVSKTVDRRPQQVAEELYGAVGEDGGGLVLVGGKPKRIPPWSPLMPTLIQLATAASEAERDAGAGEFVETVRDWSTITGTISTLSARAQPLCEPPSPIART